MRTAYARFVEQLLRHQHNQMIRQLLGIFPHALDSKAGVFEKPHPLAMGPLLRRHARAHDEVLLRSSPRRVFFREDHLVDQNARLGRHGRPDVLQDLDTLILRPVVQHVAEVVGAGSYIGV